MLDSRNLMDREVWRAFAPRLHIEHAPFFSGLTAFATTPEQGRAASELIRHEGYIHANGAQWGLDIGLMAKTVRRLSQANFLPVFAFVYDEFWLSFVRLHGLYSAILGDYRLLPNFWVWNVNPREGDAGWKPHRDVGHTALLPDRSPKSLTTWIALSQATPLNGCIYLVPANFDPTYGTPEDGSWKFDISAVRALPANAGDFFIWTQAVLHWGSRTTPRATETRVSMAFEFQRSDAAPLAQPLMQPLSMVPFEARLRLIARQILQYRHMYKVDPGIEKWVLGLAAA